MAATRITVTLNDEQLREIQAIVASGQAANTAAFVRHAISIAIADAAGWRDVLNTALAETGGPLTKKERDWADSILASRPASRRKGKAA